MSEERIEDGKYVEFRYSLVDEDDNVVEKVDLPVSYVHGAQSGIFEKVEDAMTGHMVGEEVEVTLTPDEGFGPHDPQLTFTDDIENVPPEFRRIGAEVEMQNDRGEVRKFFVSRIENGKLTVDGNHPLAGKTIRFTVEILTIRDASSDERREAVAASPTLH